MLGVNLGVNMINSATTIARTNKYQQIQKHDDLICNQPVASSSLVTSFQENQPLLSDGQSGIDEYQTFAQQIYVGQFALLTPSWRTVK